MTFDEQLQSLLRDIQELFMRVANLECKMENPKHKPHKPMHLHSDGTVHSHEQDE